MEWPRGGGTRSLFGDVSASYQEVDGASHEDEWGRIWTVGRHDIAPACGQQELGTRILRIREEDLKGAVDFISFSRSIILIVKKLLTLSRQKRFHRHWFFCKDFFFLLSTCALLITYSDCCKFLYLIIHLKSRLCPHFCEENSQRVHYSDGILIDHTTEICDLQQEQRKVPWCEIGLVKITRLGNKEQTFLQAYWSISPHVRNIIR